MASSSLCSQVLESARFVAENAKHVAVDHKAVKDLAEKLMPQFLAPSPEKATPTGLEPPGLTQTELLEWLFLLDTLNFCFWSHEPTLFTVRHGGMAWTGYRSLCAALTRAVEVGLPVYKPSYYAGISKEQLREIFRSDTNVELPLIGRRRENLLEAGCVLSEEFDGKVSELIARSEKSAQKLVSLLVQYFPSFRDEAVYRGRRVLFLKRAQIFAADVWHRFGGEGYGEFHDIDNLTMFADYRVPQSLLYFGVLVYSEELLARLRTGEQLEPGGEREVEIRGNSVWAVELIRQEMCRLAKAPPSLTETLPPNAPPSSESSRVVNSVMLDYFLWSYAKSHSSELHHLPIHRTSTIFY